MDDTYNWAYYLAETYDDEARWKPVFRRIAKRIVADLNPRTVLDVGCAVGHLVAALREEGVEAWGVDVSQAAIDHAPEAIRPYMMVHSLLEDTKPAGLPQRFDLVTNIEVLEHLYEEDLPRAMENLCAFSDRILFSSSPHDIREETHVNVRLPEYWIKMFAQQGFYRSLSYAPSYISADCLYFVRQPGMALPRLVEDYERAIRLLKDERPVKREDYQVALWFDVGSGFGQQPTLAPAQSSQFEYNYPLHPGVQRVALALGYQKQSVVADMRATIGGRMVPIVNAGGVEIERTHVHINPREQVFIDVPQELLGAEPATLTLQGHIEILSPTGHAAFITAFEAQQRRIEGFEAYLGQDAAGKQPYDVLLAECARWQQDALEKTDALQRMQASSFWRLTRPLRAAVNGGKNAVRRVCLALPGLRTVYQRKAAERDLGRDVVRFNLKHYGTLEGNRAPAAPSQQRIEEQEAVVFDPAITFSIVTPLYNTPESYLRELIQSLLGQSYPHWELCLADGSDAEHAYVGKIVAKYAKKDKRIRYQKLPQNGGIVGNSNAALAMATGPYIGLVDHDDVLGLNALFEVRQAIAEQQADFIYSDEVTFVEDDIQDTRQWNFKPDFAPDTLRALNYICHFTVFSRALLDKAGGGFQPGFDGAQDYELFLRLTEKAERIVHIPKTLYYWRGHQASTAGDPQAKPYAADAGIRALSAHLQRVGLRGTPQVAPNADTFYKINYELSGTPLVSIIIPNRNEKATLETCLNALFAKTTYPNYEVILCENGSDEADIFAYYRQLEQDSRVRVLTWEEVFNYAAINNFAARQARGDYLLFLNNDTEIISENWVQEMLMYAQREDVGAVGAKLYYPDDTLQHGGVVLGIGGTAGHVGLHWPRSHPGYVGNLWYARNVSCVTGACMMLRRSVFEELHGFDDAFAVAFNDVDLCIRIRQAGYLIVFTPFAELYHHESKSRGSDNEADTIDRFGGEVQLLQSRWKEVLARDPYYNPNLSSQSFSYEFDIQPV